MVKPAYFNQQLYDYCFKLTKESFNKYVKKIEETNLEKNNNLKIKLNNNFSNPPPNNNPYIIIGVGFGLFTFAVIFLFKNQKSK